MRISCEPRSYRVENLCLFLQYFLLKFWNFGKRRGLKEPHLKLKVSQKYEVDTKIFVHFTHPLDGGDDGDWAGDDDGHRHEEAEGEEEAVVAAVLGPGPGRRAAAV